VLYKVFGFCEDLGRGVWKWTYQFQFLREAATSCAAEYSHRFSSDGSRGELVIDCYLGESAIIMLEVSICARSAGGIPKLELDDIAEVLRSRVHFGEVGEMGPSAALPDSQDAFSELSILGAAMPQILELSAVIDPNVDRDDLESRLSSIWESAESAVCTC
jgi:hypothetical protein